MAIKILADLSKFLGSQAAVARAAGVKPPSLQKWVRIPAGRVLAIEAAVRKKGGIIVRYYMRPDIYGDSPNFNAQKSVA